MALRPYFMRQLSTRWFNIYLIASGVVFNLFAAYSIVHLWVRPLTSEDLSAHRLRMKMLDPGFCGKHLAGQTVERGLDQHFEVRDKDGKVRRIPYRSLSTSGRTADGARVEAIDARLNAALNQSTTLFLITDGARTVQGCLASYPAFRTQQLECLAASGDFSPDGNCTLKINLPSDCLLMRGTLLDGACHVPPSGRILRAALAVTERGDTCVAANCKISTEGAKK